ncbi:CehA/McbA family metallohydrolase [bacterium]|nr:CehA/McbA family metallohydrolase [candidate division CSSED10-310 bacterium]
MRPTVLILVGVALVIAAAAAQPGPSDGKGSVELLHGTMVRIGGPGTWRFRFTTADPGIAVGGGLAFVAPPFWGWSRPQNIDEQAPGYTTFTVSRRGVELIPELHDPGILILRVREAPLQAGDSITLCYGDTSNGTNPGAAAAADRFAERGQEFVFKVDGDGDSSFHPLTDRPLVDVLPGPAVRLCAYAPSIVTKGQPVEMRISALDYAADRVIDYRGTAIVECPDGVMVDNSTVQFTGTEEGSAAVLLTGLECGIYRVRVRDVTGTLTGRSNQIEIVDRSHWNLYWADLHGHSGMSDGTGTPEDYYSYARDVAGLQAAALTDHDAYGVIPLDEWPDGWERIVASTNKAYIPRRFVTFVGYEWTSWTYGHKHVLFPGETGRLISNRTPEGETPTALWRTLADTGAMTISHHPGGGPIRQDWSFHDMTAEKLVEICSIHGNSEYMGAPGMIYRPTSSGFVSIALGLGYKLGIICGGDTHNGHPGHGDPHAPLGGLTGIWAEDLTRAGLWEALQARRVYGTSGPRIILRFFLNDAFPMGSIVSGAGIERRFTVIVHAEEYLDRVQLVRNGSILEQRIITGDSLEWRVEDKAPPAGDCYYYMRVLQQDGQMAWSSPVWILA